MYKHNKYSGSCFCGDIEFSLTGDPLLVGYCHCDSCRNWSGSPVNAFTLWKKEQFNLEKGKEHVASFSKTERCTRYWCKNCGGNLFSELTQKGIVDVYAGAFRDFEFVPQIHVNYQEKVLQITDGLPKYKDLPDTSGGSGDLIPE